MSTNLPNFDKAEYVSETPRVAETQTTAGDTIPAPRPMFAPIADSPFAAWDVDATAPAQAEGSFAKAIVFGIVAAVLGCAVYAAIIVLAHFTIGYLGLFLGFFIATAMMMGSGGAGGRRYQITAAILTYLSIAMAVIPIHFWQAHDQGKAIHLGVVGVIVFGVVGLFSPFIELAGNFFQGLIGLIIIFVGIRGAWRVAAGKRL